jgi:hypothetical protein
MNQPSPDAQRISVFYGCRPFTPSRRGSVSFIRVWSVGNYKDGYEAYIILPFSAFVLLRFWAIRNTVVDLLAQHAIT